MVEIFLFNLFGHLVQHEHTQFLTNITMYQAVSQYLIIEPRFNFSHHILTIVSLAQRQSCCLWPGHGFILKTVSCRHWRSYNLPHDGQGKKRGVSTVASSRQYWPSFSRILGCAAAHLVTPLLVEMQKNVVYIENKVIRPFFRPYAIWSYVHQVIRPYFPCIWL
jgi:hypothetical protein